MGNPTLGAGPGWDLRENSKSGSATEVVAASEGKKKVMLIWTAGESWSRRDSLKVFRLGVVGEEGLMQVLKTISVFI